MLSFPNFCSGLYLRVTVSYVNQLLSQIHLTYNRDCFYLVTTIYGILYFIVVKISCNNLYIQGKQTFDSIRLSWRRVTPLPLVKYIFLFHPQMFNSRLCNKLRNTMFFVTRCDVITLCCQTLYLIRFCRSKLPQYRMLQVHLKKIDPRDKVTCRTLL